MFDCTYFPKISRKWLLSMNNEETYMSYYLGMHITKRRFRSPFREDTHPTCSFFRGKSGHLYLKDWSGAFEGDFIDVVRKRYSATYNEALRIIAEDFGYIPNTTTRKVIKIEKRTTFERKSGAEIKISMKPFTDAEFKWWGKYNISSDILKKFRVFPVKDIWLNGTKFFSNDNMLVFGYYGGRDGKRDLWRIYFPKKKPMRFLSNWPASKIQGIDQLAEKGKILVITKSLKDVMSMFSFGINAIAPNSENLFVPDEELKDLKKRFEKIIVLYDNDIPGIHNMRMIKKKYPEFEYMFIPRKFKAKDFTDFVVRFGIEKTKKVINYMIERCSKT